jgi:2-polyprenyl-3-methyl-5-hydroxy-6-metoxy-1,4-benzoquinol methylase
MSQHLALRRLAVLRVEFMNGPRQIHRISPAILRQTTGMLSAPESAEMAVPSYCHGNPLIRWLFWRRLDQAWRLADIRAGDCVFDFGIGSGVLLPTLKPLVQRVAGCDLFLAPARSMADRLGMPVELVPRAELSEWAKTNVGRFDCLFALDVLEHVEDKELRDLSAVFRTLLKPNGRFVVSGPTETIAYKIGRRIAGFRNDYHHRTIFDIDAELRRAWRQCAKKVAPPFPLPRAFLITRYEPLGVAA